MASVTGQGKGKGNAQTFGAGIVTPGVAVAGSGLSLAAAQSHALGNIATGAAVLGSGLSLAGFASIALGQVSFAPPPFVPGNGGLQKRRVPRYIFDPAVPPAPIETEVEQPVAAAKAQLRAIPRLPTANDTRRANVERGKAEYQQAQQRAATAAQEARLARQRADEDDLETILMSLH